MKLSPILLLLFSVFVQFCVPPIKIFADDNENRSLADSLAEGMRLGEQRRYNNAQIQLQKEQLQIQREQQALIQNQINQNGPFKDPDYLDYLRYTRTMDDLVAKGEIKSAEAETRKYQAWGQFKERQRAQQYNQMQLGIQTQQLNTQQQGNFNQERSTFAQEQAASAQERTANAQ